MVMTPKEKKAFVARMKKGRAAAKKSGGGKSKMIKVNKKALQSELNSLLNEANRIGDFPLTTTKKSMSYHIKRLQSQVKKIK